MNIEFRMSKEGILSIFIYLKDRAQRFHPSKFDTAESFDSELTTEWLTTEGLVAGCGSLFCCSAVRFALVLQFVVQP